MMKSVYIFSGILAAVLLAACGGEPEDVATTPAKPVVAPEPVKDDPTARMARAVGGGKPGAAVELKYEFASKPAVGVPVEIELALVPTAGVESMNLTVSGMDGITLAGTLEHSVADAEAGEVYRHTVSVLPDRTGVFYVTAVVTTTFSSATLARTFSIPFVVGSPPPAEKPAVDVDSESGEPIHSLPAEQPR